jgi:hypothetical protein
VETVTVKKAELIEKLAANRDAHKATYEEAKANWLPPAGVVELGIHACLRNRCPQGMQVRFLSPALVWTAIHSQAETYWVL